MREDIKLAVKEFHGNTALQKGNIETIEKALWEDEKVYFATGTNAIVCSSNPQRTQKLPGFAILTNQRFIFAYKALWEHKMETVSVRDIQSVSCFGNGITGGHVEIQTITKTYNLLVYYKKDLIQKIQSVFDKVKNEAVMSFQSPSSGFSAADELKKYKELLDLGAITSEEYDAKKSQLLNI